MSNPYTDMADAIVMTAIEDWRKLCKQLIKPRKIRKPSDDMLHTTTFHTLRVFLKSPWCDTLSSIEPQKILDRLEKEKTDAERRLRATKRAKQGKH